MHLDHLVNLFPIPALFPASSLPLPCLFPASSLPAPGPGSLRTGLIRHLPLIRSSHSHIILHLRFLSVESGNL